VRLHPIFRLSRTLRGTPGPGASASSRVDPYIVTRNGRCCLRVEKSIGETDRSGLKSADQSGASLATRKWISPIKRKILVLWAQVIVTCAAVYVGQQSIEAQGVAPDGPGGNADWLPANKTGFGTWPLPSPLRSIRQTPRWGPGTLVDRLKKTPLIIMLVNMLRTD